MPFARLSPDWDRCLHLFLQSILDHSGSHAAYATYRSTLRRFFAYLGKSPETVSRTDVMGFIQLPSSSKRNPGRAVSASTKNQRRAILSSFYRFASLYEREDGSPLYQKALPTAGIRSLVAEVSYATMSEDEIEQFFAAIPTGTLKGLRDRALFLFYFLTGRRRSEIYALRARDIEATIIVDEDGQRRPGHVYHYRGKGASRQIRIKELPAVCYRALSLYLDKRGHALAPTDYLFTSIRPGQGRADGRTGVPLHKDYINREFKRYAARAKLDPLYSLHTLRHSSARLRYLAGSPLQDIQHALDHASLATTDIYIRHLVGVSDKGARLLEARFGHLSMPN